MRTICVIASYIAAELWAGRRWVAAMAAYVLLVWLTGAS